MAVSVVNDENKYIVSHRGRLDSATTAEFEQALNEVLANQVDELTINLEQTEYISSKGLRALVAAQKKLGGKVLNIVNTNKAVYEILRLAALDKIKGFNITRQE